MSTWMTRRRRNPSLGPRVWVEEGRSGRFGSGALFVFLLVSFACLRSLPACNSSRLPSALLPPYFIPSKALAGYCEQQERWRSKQKTNVRRQTRPFFVSFLDPLLPRLPYSSHLFLPLFGGREADLRSRGNPIGHGLHANKEGRRLASRAQTWFEDVAIAALNHFFTLRPQLPHPFPSRHRSWMPSSTLGTTLSPSCLAGSRLLLSSSSSLTSGSSLSPSLCCHFARLRRH